MKTAKAATAFLIAICLAVLSACGDGGQPEGTPTPSPTLTPTPTLPPSTPTSPVPTPTPAPPSPAPPSPTPTPEPTPQQVHQPTWTIFQLSRGDQVDVVLEDGLNAYTVVSVDPETVQFEKWDIDFVVDLDADGVDDAIVIHFTGGAHCCFEYLIFSEAPDGIQLDDSFSLGNAVIGAVEDLDGDGVPELETGDDRLAYFPDLSYAGSPFLPLVLCRSTQRVYYDCTPQFPQYFQDSAEEFEIRLADAVQQQQGEEAKRSAALGLLASYLRLELAPEGWSRVRALCPECEGWLTENLSELQQRLSHVQPFRGEQ
jgi:hypothetical protein